MAGTTGPLDAASVSNGIDAVVGGFWIAVVNTLKLFLPLIAKSHSGNDSGPASVPPLALLAISSNGFATWSGER